MAGNPHLKLPGDLKIILPGIPGVANRGFLGFCTVCLFKIDQQWALFDTGHYSDRTRLLEALGQAGVSPQEIKFVVLSHLHFDHALNLPLFDQAEVFISRAEMQYAKAVSCGGLQDPSLVDSWQRLFEGRTLHQIGDSRKIASGLELVTLPGHTPGCMALLMKEQGRCTAICGDVIKNAWEALNCSSGMAMAGAGLAAKSIAKLKEWADLLVPGHDRPFSLQQGEPVFLSDLQFSVQMSAYPNRQDQAVLELELSK